MGTRILGPQILVIGYANDHCTQKAFEIAHEVGREIGRKKAVLITGGLGGVMEAASKGAHEERGLVVGIIPQEDKSFANLYCDILICTGMGYARNFVTAYSADSVIMVGGGAGTEIEALAAYSKSKPIIAIVGSGGAADKLAGTYLDSRRLMKVIPEKDVKRAVKIAIELAAIKQSK